MATPKMTKMTPEEAARAHRMAKDKRRKDYEDIQIQGTNNSSIVSKRSVEMLYTTKVNPEMGEWFKYFVKTPKRRSPAINRGYWLRMESIKRLVLKIILENPGKAISIVNLGCGFDPFPFQMLSEFRSKSQDSQALHFIDIDYPDLVNNKMGMMKESSEIMDLLGEPKEEVKTHKNIVMSFKNYSLIGCNLRDLDLFNSSLKQVNDAEVTIFIAEVSLAYMKPEFSDPVIANASRYVNSHFIILEQLLPVGSSYPFAKKMIYHFDHLRSPLGCITKYPTLNDQRERFAALFTKVQANDLMYHWINSIDYESKAKISNIEAFDEWEEFIIFCQHYCVIYATNQNNSVVDTTEQSLVSSHLQTAEVANIICSKDVAKDVGKIFQLKFPGVTQFDNNVYVFGGSGQQRSNEIYELISPSECKKIVVSGEVPEAKMCHTFTNVSGAAYSIGGRSRPGKEFSTIEKFDFSTSTWSKVGDIGKNVSRHATVLVSNDELLVFHGSEFILYSTRTNSCKRLRLSNGSEAIPVLHSCGMTFYNGIGYLVGGVTCEVTPCVSEIIYSFQLNEDRTEVTIHPVCQGLEYAVIGSKVAVYGEYLYIVPSTNLYEVVDYVLRVPLEGQKSVEKIKVNEMLVGFGLVVTENGLEMVGGGGVCYSFGSYFNFVSRLEVLQPTGA